MYEPKFKWKEFLLASSNALFKGWGIKNSLGGPQITYFYFLNLAQLLSRGPKTMILKNINATYLCSFEVYNFLNKIQEKLGAPKNWGP
jgi:hypothetical protein